MTSQFNIIALGFRFRVLIQFLTSKNDEIRMDILNSNSFNEDSSVLRLISVSSSNDRTVFKFWSSVLRIQWYFLLVTTFMRLSRSSSITRCPYVLDLHNFSDVGKRSSTVGFTYSKNSGLGHSVPTDFSPHFSDLNILSEIHSKAVLSRMLD